jgi:hypothetical protein
MPEFPDAGHAASIAYNELRVGYRKVRDQNLAQIVALGFFGLLVLAFTVGATWAAYVGGQSFAGNAENLSNVLALVPAGVAVFAVTLSAYLVALQYGDVDVRDGYLTTVPARDVVGGLLLAGYLKSMAPFAVPMVAATAGFGIGAGAPLAVPLGALAVLALTTASFAVGFPLGTVVAYLLGQSEFVDRYKTALAALAFLGYFALIFTNALGDVIQPVLDVAQTSPVAWYGDLVLLAVPAADASPLRAAVVLLGSLAVVVAAVPASVRACQRRWYDDKARAGERETESVSSGRLDGLLGRRTAWVARKSWLRARRAPVKLLYVVYPVFILFTPLQQSVEAGHVTGGLVTTVALYSAWATGALFTLNPLGDEGAVLPVTVTSGISGRQFVGGLVAASAVVGTPVTAGLAIVLGVLSPLGAVATACVVVAALVLPTLAAVVAAGVGTAFPKYDATTITRGSEAVVPSMWAFGVYSLGFLLTAGFATGFQTPGIAGFVADALGTSQPVVHVASLAVGVLLAGGAAALAARVAVRSFDDYTAHD